MRYRVSHLYAEIDRYHVHTLLLLGPNGPYEYSREMLRQLVRDGFANAVNAIPSATSPWLLSVPRTGFGLLSPNPGGKHNKEGTRGSVRLRLPGRSCQPGVVGGSTRARRIYQGRKPISDAPLEERIKGRRVLRVEARRAKELLPTQPH